MIKIKKTLILLLVVVFLSPDAVFCAADKNFKLRPPLLFSKSKENIIIGLHAPEPEDGILLSEEVTFRLNDTRRGMVLQRLAGIRMIQQIDWLASFTREADREIIGLARLRQERLILDDVYDLTFLDGKTIKVDSQECLFRLIEETRNTTFYKVMLEILTNAYDSCVRRMVGKDIVGGGEPIDVGRIGFSMAIKNGNLIISVSDNGEGILKGTPSNPVFRRYYGKYDDLINGGQGLGIHIVRALLKYHGGTIEWRGSPGYPEGFGTKAVVILPISGELSNQIMQLSKAQPESMQEILGKNFRALQDEI